MTIDPYLVFLTAMLIFGLWLLFSKGNKRFRLIASILYFIVGITLFFGSR